MLNNLLAHVHGHSDNSTKQSCVISLAQYTLIHNVLSDRFVLEIPGLCNHMILVPTDPLPLDFFHFFPGTRNSIHL